MRKEFEKISQEAAKFFYDCYSFFRDLSLLLKEVSRELTAQGYTVQINSYYLPYVMLDTDVYEGFKINKAFIGKFYDRKDVTTQELVHYTYGIIFKEKIKPDSQLSQWIPCLHFMRGELTSHQDWDIWWNAQILDILEVEQKSSPKFRYIAAIESSSEISKLKNISVAIKSVYVLKVPLGALNSTDDVIKITGVAADVLRKLSEVSLKDVEDNFLVVNNDVAL